MIRQREKDDGIREYNIGPGAPRRTLLLILSLDTTTRTGSVAVLRDRTILADLTGDPALTHGQRLPLDLLRTVEVAGVRLEEIQLLAVAAGPGSFTGLRVGIATVQGLAFARGLKIVPVSTLEALAREAGRGAARDVLIAPWVDAQRGEIFAALYEPDGITERTPPSSRSPSETLRTWRRAIGAGHVIFAGDGALRYRHLIDAILGDRAQVLEPVPSLAPVIGRIAALEPGRAVLPHAVVPIYIRRPDAELARGRQAGG